MQGSLDHLEPAGFQRRHVRLEFSLGRTVAGKDGSLTEGKTGCARDSFPLRSSLQFEITTLKKKEHSVMK